MKQKTLNLTLALTLFLVNSCSNFSGKRSIAASSDYNYCSFLLKDLASSQDLKTVLSKTLEVNAIYGVNLVGHSKISYLTYRSTVEENGKVFLLFQKAHTDGVIRGDETVKLEFSTIFALKKNAQAPTQKSSSPSSSLVFELSKIPLTFAMESVGWAKLMFRPYRPLMKKGSLEIVSQSFFTGSRYKKQAQTIIKQFDAFDKDMSEAGFLTPLSTKIVLLKKPLLIKSFYSQVIPYDILRIKNGAQHFTLLNPLLAKAQLNFGDTIMVHERGHSLIRRTFKFESFMVQKNMFQESFVDVLSAHHFNNPKIGMDAITEGQEIRDISKSLSYDIDGREFTAKSLLDIQKAHEHNLSLFPSAILWKMREQRGQQNFYKTMKTISENLNNYYDSFASSEFYNKTEANKSDFEFFMATLLKLSEENKDFSLYKKALTQHLKEINMDYNQINNIKNALKLSEKTYTYEGRPVMTEMFITVGGGSMAAFSGYIIYSLLNNE